MDIFVLQQYFPQGIVQSLELCIMWNGYTLDVYFI